MLIWAMDLQDKINRSICVMIICFFGFSSNTEAQSRCDLVIKEVKNRKKDESLVQVILQEIVALSLELSERRSQGILNPILEKSIRKALEEKYEMAQKLGLTLPTIAKKVKQEQSKKESQRTIKPVKKENAKIVENLEHSNLTFSSDAKTLYAYQHLPLGRPGSDATFKTNALSIKDLSFKEVDFAPELSRNLIGHFDVGRSANGNLVIKNQEGFEIFNEPDISSIQFDRHRGLYIAFKGDRSQTFVIHETGRVETYRGFVYSFSENFEMGVTMRNGGFEISDIGMAESLQRLSPEWTMSASGLTLVDSDFGTSTFYRLGKRVSKIRDYKSNVHPILKNDSTAIFHDPNLSTGASLIILDINSGGSKEIKSQKPVVFSSDYKWAVVYEDQGAGMKALVYDLDTANVVSRISEDVQAIIGNKLLTRSGIHDINTNSKLGDLVEFSEIYPVGQSARFYILTEKESGIRSLLDLDRNQIRPLMRHQEDLILISGDSKVLIFSDREANRIEIVNVENLTEYLLQ